MGRPRSEEARAKILAGAAELALSVGVRAFTIEELARRTGVAKTTIYRHFGSKNQLLIAALDGITPVPVSPDTGSLRQDLIDFLTSVLPIFADPKLRALFLDVFATCEHDPELKRLQQTMMGERLGTLATVIERAKARGDIAGDFDNALAVEIVEGPLIVRSLGSPETLCDLDLEAVADRALLQLTAS